MVKIWIDHASIYKWSFCLSQWVNGDLNPPTSKQNGTSVYMIIYNHKQIVCMIIILLFYCLYWRNLTIPNNFILHCRAFPEVLPMLHRKHQQTTYPLRSNKLFTLKSSPCSFHKSYTTKPLYNNFYPIPIKSSN